MKRALVLGAGGFIGSHMVKRLKSEGYWVRGVDRKYPEFSESQADSFMVVDLVSKSNMILATMLADDNDKWDEIYQYAAEMGGAGFIFTGEHDAEVMYNSTMINYNLLNELERMNFKGRVFFASSACIYPQEIQQDENQDCSLKEDMAYPANPDSEYGWEKLYAERSFLACARNYGINVRIGRFHNIYGPEGTYKGGREKAPAAMCRKVIEATDEIEIWGDGHQTRSFLYIDDCIDATRLLMQSGFSEPINIGSEEEVSIRQLINCAAHIGLKSNLKIKSIKGPLGVRGRNSNNDLIREVLNWEPKYSLLEGIEKTYRWIEQQMKNG